VNAKKARRGKLRVSHVWIIWYAVILHTVWGCLLLLSPSAYGATAIHIFHGLPRDLIASVLFLASGMAVWAVTRPRPSLRSLAALLPQQGLLTLSAYGAVAAVVVAHYGDGVSRPRLFILADQAPAIIALILHTAALAEMHARGADGDLLRIIRLFREGDPAEVHDVLVALAGQEPAQRGEQIPAGLARRGTDGKPPGERPPESLPGRSLSGGATRAP